MRAPRFLPGRGCGTPVSAVMGEALLYLAFLAGVLLGTSAGSNFISRLPLYAAPAAPSGASYFLSLWRAARFVLAAFFLGTTVLGPVLIPLLCALRGCLLGCASAQMMAACTQRPLAAAFCAVGLPALLSLPCFLLVCRKAQRRSAALLRLTAGRASGPVPGLSAGLLSLVSLLLSLSGAVDTFLAPWLWDKFCL